MPSGVAGVGMWTSRPSFVLFSSTIFYYPWRIPYCEAALQDTNDKGTRKTAPPFMYPCWPSLLAFTLDVPLLFKRALALPLSSYFTLFKHIEDPETSSTSSLSYPRINHVYALTEALDL